MDPLAEVTVVAAEVVAAGFVVLPVALSSQSATGTIAKRPATAHGHLNAVADIDEFTRLAAAARLREGEVLGVGFVPGSAGCIVLDCDAKNGRQGRLTLARLEATHGEFAAASWTSPSGGLNVLVAKPDERHYSNHSPWPDIDVRADAGWVVAPGVTSPWGGWQWQFGEFADVATLPPALAAELIDTALRGRPASSRETIEFISASLTTSAPAARKLFEERLQRLAAATSGSRHQALLEIVGFTMALADLDLRAAMADICAVWEQIVAGENREDEPWAVVRWVVGQELASRNGEPPTDVNALVLPAPFMRASGLRTSLQRWVWEDMIPAGELTTAAGREKLGKSTALVWVAARLTLGELPGFLEGVPCDVLFASAEDHALRVLLPRLDLAGADRERLFFLDPLGPGFSVKAVRELDAGLGLIVLDPLSVFLDLPAHNEHGENATRRALLPFVELAQDFECGLVGIRHFNKGSVKDNPFDIVMGSRAYSAAARSVLFFTPDREQRNRAGGLVFAKGNLAADSSALRYRLDIHDLTLDDGNTGRLPLFVPDGHVPNVTLDDALGSDEEATELGRATEFLTEVLADGPVREKDVKRLAAEEHIAERTLRRAKDNLDATSSRVGGLGSDGWWEWTLPPKTAT